MELVTVVVLLHFPEWIFLMQLQVYDLLLSLLELHEMHELLLRDGPTQCRVSLLPKDLSIIGSWSVADDIPIFSLLVTVSIIISSYSHELFMVLLQLSGSVLLIFDRLP
jgi:hypothetical protein